MAKSSQPALVCYEGISPIHLFAQQLSIIDVGLPCLWWCVPGDVYKHRTQLLAIYGHAVVLIWVTCDCRANSKLLFDIVNNKNHTDGRHIHVHVQ